MKKTKTLLSAAWILGGLAIMWGCYVSFPATAADGQGANERGGVSANVDSYNANSETAVFDTLLGTDTVTGLELPVSKFTQARIFRLNNPLSQSVGTKSNLKIQLKFSVGGASATVWVVYYYVTPGADPSLDASYTLVALSQPLGGTLTATAAQDGARFLSLASVEDSFAATHCVVFSDSITSGDAEAWLGSY